MKRIIVLALLMASVASTGVASASRTGSAEPASVTIVHAATYDAPEPFPVTVCVDGSVLDDDLVVGEQLGPIDLAPATYDVDIYSGAGGDCTGVTSISGQLTPMSGDDLTVVAVFDSDGPGLVTFENDRSCIEAGNARVAAVHGAAAGVVDVYASAAGVAPESPALFPDLAESTYAGPVTVAAGDYDVVVVPNDGGPSGTPAISVPGLTLADGTSTVIYAIGGNDGELGAFALVEDRETCPEETTTSTSTTTTTTTTVTVPGEPPAAQPISGNAGYTG